MPPMTTMNFNFWMNGMGFNPYGMPSVAQPKVVQHHDDGSAYWICQTCGTHNFHKGSQCHGCGQSWLCPQCTFNNYAFRNECLRCKTPKPADPPSVDPASVSTSLVTMQP